MTLDQLLALDAIVQTGTFRGAAEHLNKSQSAVSHLIKSLEGQTGVTLLSREGYRPELTPEGQIYYAQASRVLHHMRTLKTTALGLAANQESEIGLAYTPTMPTQTLIKAVGHVHEAFPHTHIRLYKEVMGGLMARLMDNSAQIIIAGLEGFEPDQIEAVPYRTTHIKPIAHPDYPLSQCEGVKTLGDMYSYTQIVVADSSEGRYTQSRDVLPGSARLTVSDFETKLALIKAQKGWGGLPCYLVHHDIEEGRLKALSIDGYPQRRSRVYKIRRRDQAIGRVADALWQALGTEADQDDEFATGPGLPASMTNFA